MQITHSQSPVRTRKAFRRKLLHGALTLLLGGVFFAGPAKAQDAVQPSGTSMEAPQPKDEPRIGHAAFAATLKTLLDHSVPEMPAADLAGQLASGSGQKPLLLDARELAEYRVSHLEGARWVGYDDFGLDRVSDLHTDQPIVVYCSVGYRSEKVAERLRAAGYQQVYNLYGGIFEWVNQQQGVVDMEGRPTDQIHAYSKTWGVFLRRGEKVY